MIPLSNEDLLNQAAEEIERLQAELAAARGEDRDDTTDDTSLVPVLNLLSLTPEQARDILGGAYPDGIDPNDPNIIEADYRFIMDEDSAQEENWILAERGADVIRGLHRIADRTRDNQVRASDSRRLTLRSAEDWRNKLTEIRQGPPESPRSLEQIRANIKELEAELGDQDEGSDGSDPSVDTQPPATSTNESNDENVLARARQVVGEGS